MINTESIVKILIALVGVALLWIGLSVIFGSKRAQYSETARTSFNALAGLVLVALGGGSFALVAFGSKIVKTLFDIG